jgi:hypothetical protein
MEDVRCNRFVHCCAARRPGSGVGWPRSSPSPPPACRPRARRPAKRRKRCSSATTRVSARSSVAEVQGRVAKAKYSPSAIESVARRSGRPPLLNRNSTISFAMCEINHMIFNPSGALLPSSGGRFCPGSSQAGASIDRCGIWRKPGGFGRSTGWIQNKVRGFPCRIASRNAASD